MKLRRPYEEVYQKVEANTARLAEMVDYAECVVAESVAYGPDEYEEIWLFNAQSVLYLAAELERVSREAEQLREALEDALAALVAGRAQPGEPGRPDSFAAFLEQKRAAEKKARAALAVAGDGPLVEWDGGLDAAYAVCDFIWRHAHWPVAAAGDGQPDGGNDGE